jgi:hypothetical protein
VNQQSRKFDIVFAAREQLDAAIANMLKAAFVELSEYAQHCKALAESGKRLERRRLQAILLQRIDMHPFESDPVRGELLQLLEAVAES